MASSVLRHIPWIHYRTSSECPASKLFSEYVTDLRGITLIESASNSDYPYSYGAVVTFCISASRGFQINVSEGTAIKVRSVNNGIWTSWKDVTVTS